MEDLYCQSLKNKKVNSETSSLVSKMSKMNTSEADLDEMWLNLKKKRDDDQLYF